MIHHTKVIEDKKLLRDFYKKRRAEFLSLQTRKLDQYLSNQLLSNIQQDGSLWVSYRRFGSEADPFLATQKSNLRWAYPRVDGENLRFWVPHDSQAWVKSKLGILEPDPTRSTEVLLNREVKGILVPGLAFDRRGIRLGYGRGFYDRILAGFKGYKIGVAYSVQISSTPLPRQQHDQSVAAIVTELEWIQTTSVL